MAFAVAALLAGCGVLRPARMVPEGIRYVPRSAWGAAAPVLPMKRHVPSRITLHHTGEPQHPERTVEEKMRALQRFSQTSSRLESGRTKPVWADVPYHLYVATDGSVAEGRDVRFAGDSNTPYDPAGHLLVVVEGNFETDTLTAAQRRTLDRLVPALARRWHVPPERIASHRDFAETLCPGKALYAELPHFRALVAGGADGGARR